MARSRQLHSPRTGQHLTFLGATANDGVLRVDVRLDPGGFVPRHAHLSQDERVTVLAGTLEIRVGSASRTLRRGDTAEVPRRSAHIVSNAGADDARFLLEV